MSTPRDIRGGYVSKVYRRGMQEIQTRLEHTESEIDEVREYVVMLRRKYPGNSVIADLFEHKTIPQLELRRSGLLTARAVLEDQFCEANQLVEELGDFPISKEAN